MSERRGYWRAADAEEVLDLWRQSGLNLSAFARQRGLCRNRLARWRDRLAGPAESTELKFHRVRVVEGRRQEGDGASIEIHLAGGRRVVIRPGFDESFLAEVVRVLESLPC